MLRSTTARASRQIIPASGHVSRAPQLPCASAGKFSNSAQMHSHSPATIPCRHYSKSKPRKVIGLRVKATSSPPTTTASLSEQSTISRGASMSGSPLLNEVVYRKEGSKIVAVSPEDQLNAPISSIFAQTIPESHEALDSAISDHVPVDSNTIEQSLSLSELPLKDIFPSEEILTELLKTMKKTCSPDQILGTVSELQQAMDGRPESKKKLDLALQRFNKQVYGLGLTPYDIGSWAAKYSRLGSGLALQIFKHNSGRFLDAYSYATLLYRGGPYIQRDVKAARQILHRLSYPTKINISSSGFPPAQMALAGILARDDKNFKEASKLYENAGRNGEDRAYLMLARMYLDGDLERDDAQAKKYIELATRNENLAEASFLLGSFAATAQPPDLKAAHQHYVEAAKKGLPEAQYNVGAAYFRGQGVDKNDTMAIEYWKMAATQGFGLAQLSLGAYYFQDEQQGELSNSPATDSNTDHEVTKAPAVKHEWDPSKRDLMQAHKWFTLASRRPGELGAEGLRLRQKVEKQISHGKNVRDGGGSCNIM